MVPRGSRPGAGRQPDMPILDARQILFRDVPISWSEWSDVWTFDEADAIYPDPIAHGMCILPPLPTNPRPVA
jgi:hypothetical protein